MAIQFKSKQLQNYRFIRSETKTTHGHFYELCDIFVTKTHWICIGFPYFCGG